jgi:hypothetical protein
MNRMRFGPCGLVLTLVIVGAAQAQPPGMASNGREPLTIDAKMPLADSPAPASAHSGLSSWITYVRPDCCGPVGGDGPVQSEIFFRSGLSVPIGGNFFGRGLDLGWLVQGGGRALFYDVPQENAWTLEISVSNEYNHATRFDAFANLKNIIVPNPNAALTGVATITLPNIVVTPRSFNRTFFNAAAGHEWYLLGAANTDEVNWRVGVDLGGQLGTGKLKVNELQHRTGALYGTTLAVHSDIEYPCGKAVFIGGIRGEWKYSFTEKFLQREADMQSLNFLITSGIRF